MLLCLCSTDIRGASFQNDCSILWKQDHNSLQTYSPGICTSHLRFFGKLKSLFLMFEKAIKLENNEVQTGA